MTVHYIPGDKLKMFIGGKEVPELRPRSMTYEVHVAGVPLHAAPPPLEGRVEFRFAEPPPPPTPMAVAIYVNDADKKRLDAVGLPKVQTVSDAIRWWLPGIPIHVTPYAPDGGSIEYSNGSFGPLFAKEPPP